MRKEEFLSKPKSEFIKIYLFIILSFDKVEASNIYIIHYDLHY